LAGKDLREEVPLNDKYISTIAIKNSASEISEEGVALSSKIEVEEDGKPAAKSFEQTHTNLGILQQERNMEKKVAPKVPMVGNIPSNDRILQWLEKQNPVLADSFAQECNISTNNLTRIFQTPKNRPHTLISIIPTELR
jgi:hypothetical protein